MYRISLGITLFFLFFSTSFAKTITIPADAGSIHETVSLAISGDTIRLETDVVYWMKELVIENKDLEIQGRSAEAKTLIKTNDFYYENMPVFYPYPVEKRPATLLIKNSNVTLEKVNLEKPLFAYRVTGSLAYPVGTQIKVESGTLSILESEIHCSIDTQGDLSIQNTLLYGYSKTHASHHEQGYEEIPAIKIGPASNIQVSIIKSFIQENGFEGIQIKSVSDSLVNIEECQVYSGRNQDFGGSRVYVDGRSGIHIQDSNNIDLELIGSLIQAKEGSLEGKGTLYPFGLTPSRGGYGMWIEDSNVEIRGGTVRGGTGSRGEVITDLYYQRVTNGGPGGHGLVLQKSTVAYQDTLWLPGQGGSGNEKEGKVANPGEDGLSYVLDELSVLRNLTNIQHWMCY